jgi:hypothetical protein
MTTKEFLAAKIEECERSARENGWEGEEFDLTKGDAEYVAAGFRERFGRLPYKAEWLEFFGWVGESHCEEYA